MNEALQLQITILALNEDLSSIAKMVSSLMKQFSISRMGDLMKLMKEKQLPSELESLLDVVKKEYKVNSKTALKFVTDLIDLKISLGAV